MNCLTREETQKYIDNELSADMHNCISNHIKSCDICKGLHSEVLKDVKQLHKYLQVFQVDTESIPPVENIINAQKTSVFTTPVFIKSIAAIILILVTLSILIPYFDKPDRITESEWIVNNLLNDNDPNKQWNDNQILITITNSSDELVLSFALDNSDKINK